jgi:DNA-binding XRE family transcriptional regulator
LENLKVLQGEIQANNDENIKQLSDLQDESGDFIMNGTTTEEKSMENSLAVFLKEKRIVAGLSQKDVALKLGYSTSQFISNWERGISQPPLATLRKIAELYKVSADEMFNVLLKSTITQVEIDLKKKFYSKDTTVSN